MTRLSDRIGVVFLGRVTVLGSTLLFRMLLARMTTQEELGTYNQVWLLYVMISPILLYGVATSVAYFIPQLPEEERKGFVGQTFVYLLVASLVFSAGIYLSASALTTYFHNPKLLPLLEIFAWYPVLALPISFLSNLFIALDRAKEAALSDVLYRVSTPVAVLIPLFLGRDLISALVSNNIVQAAVFCGGTAYLWWRYRGVKLTWRKGLARAQFVYSTPIGLSYVLSSISRQLGGAIVSMFYPVGQFAVYSVGAFEIPLVKTFSSAMNSVLLPRFVRLHKEGRIEEMLGIWHKSILKLALLIMPVFTCLFLVAPQLVVLLYTERYLESAILVRIYLCLYPIRVAQYSMLLNVTGDTRAIFWGNALYLGLNLLLTFTLLPAFGLAGPALADVLATVAMALFLLGRVRQFLRITWRSLFPWGALTRVMAIAIAVGVLVYPILLLPLPNVFTLLLFGVVYVPVYAGAAYKLGALETSDLALARDWVGLRFLFR
ncbi:MAG TPA: oligosaccharide flippase family protein [Anaerolineae bacterium]|nr:oligosaccharide flippase family protein [Anaerolineae bacterium]